MKKLFLFTATLLAMAGFSVSQAAVLHFDSPTAFSDHFTRWSNEFPYNASTESLRLTGSNTSLATLGNETYDPGSFLTETVSVTYSQTAFGTGPSMGLVVRADTSEGVAKDITGILGFVNINSSGTVRLRLGAGTVASAGTNFYDVQYTGLNLNTGMTFTFSIEQRNLTIDDDIQAQVRLLLSDADTSAIYVESPWINVPGLNSYVSAGAVGLRVYPASTSTAFHIYDFSPVPETIPEPSASLLLLGLGAAGWLVKKRKTNWLNG